MDENMEKWPQTETGSQTGAFTLRTLYEFHYYKPILIQKYFVFISIRW